MKKMRSVRSRRGGFTLIEVLVALVVTVSALAIIAQGLTTGGRSSIVSQNATRAALIAERVITGLETGEIDLTASTSSSFDDEPDFSYEVLSFQDPLVTGLDDVTVTIHWTERGEPRTYVVMRIMKDPTATPAPTTTPTSP